ncbi:P-loop containing nucleoside triphosphate hydrolase protein [Xylaria sp. FL0933]|nr:P-loop containing nucleoside triphosphate hydrolase protein [Xylaria sp. FL0933]
MDQSLHKRHIGVSFMNLNCYGIMNTSKYQATFISYPLGLIRSLAQLLGLRQVERVKILNEFNGLIRAGDMLLVLGRPGSGCSTFLKALAGDTEGLTLEPETSINYQGMRSHQGHRAYREDALYLAELDVHLPELTVKQTLEFAASTRQQDQSSFATRAYSVAAQFELNQALDTKVGNAMIRGVSGGEKRRTSIAEAFLGGAQLQCWDNSTRGLDSGTAYRFIQMLRASTIKQQSTVALTLYQASEAIYQSFDKVILLYEGHQIYFGPVGLAAGYFISLGFVKHDRATTADFLTSITNPSERVVRNGLEEEAPRSPTEFANVWKRSDLAKSLVAEIEEFNSRSVGDSLTRNENNGIAPSKFMLPIYYQAFICTLRAVKKIQMNPAPTIGNVIANAILGVIIGSAYYNLHDDTNSLQQRATLIFFALIVNSFLPAYEVSVYGLLTRAHIPPTGY